MDFARKQLEKFGWKDGKGLGKDNQGMVDAIKPSLKVGKEGMGYDFSKELTDTWWTRAYDDSLKRINVDEEAETVGVTLQEDDKADPGKDVGGEERPFQKMRKRMLKATFTTFSKGATLSNGEMVAEPKSESDSESEDDDKKKSKEFKKLTDEDLLKACGGRTAHKAARFGLKLNGKLARIAAQEEAAKAFLSKQTSTSAYSRISSPFPPEEEIKSSTANAERKKRKKKDERVSVHEFVNQETCIQHEAPEQKLESPESTKKKKKHKKRKYQELESASEEPTNVLASSIEENETVDKKKRKKSKKNKRKLDDEEERLFSD